MDPRFSVRLSRVRVQHSLPPEAYAARTLAPYAGQVTVEELFEVKAHLGHKVGVMVAPCAHSFFSLSLSLSVCEQL